MKNYCKYCGERLFAESTHKCSQISIGYFITRLACFWKSARTKSDDVKKGNFDFFEKGKLIVPDSIKEDAGEVPIKQYDLAILRSRAKLTKAEGRLQVTNKRLLFRANGFSPAGKITYQQEFAIDKVDGVEIRKDFRFSIADLFLCWFILPFLFTFAMGLVALFDPTQSVFGKIMTTLLSIAITAPFFVFRKKYFLSFLSSGVGLGLSVVNIAIGKVNEEKAFFVLSIIFCIYIFVINFISLYMNCFKPSLRVELKTSGGTNGMQIRHKYVSFIMWNKMEEYSGFSEILPGKDADLAIDEIGSIIDGIKTRGDAIFEENDDWGN